MKKTITKTRKGKRTTNLSSKKLHERVQVYMQAEQKLLAKHGLAKRLVISFPHSGDKIPFFGKIGQTLLTWSRAVLDTQYGDLTKR